MIKIDLSTFNLVCTRNSDGRKFIYKYKTKMDIRLIDCESGKVLDLSQAIFRKNFTPDEETNKRNKKRPSFMNFGKRRIA